MYCLKNTICPACPVLVVCRYASLRGPARLAVSRKAIAVMKGRDTISVLHKITPIFAVLFIQTLATKQRLLALVTLCCPMPFGKLWGSKLSSQSRPWALSLGPLQRLITAFLCRHPCWPSLDLDAGFWKHTPPSSPCLRCHNLAQF